MRSPPSPARHAARRKPRRCRRTPASIFTNAPAAARCYVQSGAIAACSVPMEQFLARRCRHRGVSTTETSDDEQGSCRLSPRNLDANGRVVGSAVALSLVLFELSRILLPAISLTARGQRIPVTDVGEGFEATLMCTWSDLVVAIISHLKDHLCPTDGNSYAHG
jgi:hypothetical protein